MKKPSQALLAAIIISFLAAPSIASAVGAQGGAARAGTQAVAQENVENEVEEREFSPAVKGNGLMLHVDEADPKLMTYREKLAEERQLRATEMVQVKNQGEEGMMQTMLQSRQSNASLSQGAAFTIDPVTNLVTVTTPSGLEHVLYNLPDQAILRMEEAGLITAEEANLPIDELGELIINATEDGLVYELQAPTQRKFLGIFNRQVPRRIALVDDTGEVTTSPVERNLLQTILDRLSF
ncbi:MAG: hypothetical protein ABII10_02920 [Candidatus Paceibacterota bacterium]